MKTLFSKVPGLGLFKHDKRRSHAIDRSITQADELSNKASQDMQDMRDRYDSFLSAAASTTNTAFEFSESLQEMGDCLLDKTALTDDDENGKVLLMLGKAQFNIQKLLDNYRSHIYKTITAPSQSLLNELQIVEDMMKRQCDEKRSTYEEGLKKQHENGRSKKSKEVHVSSRQLQLARDQFDECATLFIFRMKSLKKGQSRSLLTQATRHYAAQMCFFRKALESLEAIEPHVKSTTEEQHIDYCFSGLEDDDDDKDSAFFTDNEDEDEDNMNYSRKNYEVPFSENTKPVYVNTGSKSAPISMEDSFDNNDKHQQMRRSSTTTGKLNTYVLPTPVESQRSQPSNIWRSMPLEHKKYEKKPMLSDSGPIGSTAVSSLPKIRELHELPKPPGIKKPSKLGFSEPLMTFNRGPGFNDPNKVSLFDATYRLQVPSRSERDAVLASKQKEMLRTDKGMVSPPLSPISFKNNLQGSTAI